MLTHKINNNHTNSNHTNSNHLVRPILLLTHLRVPVHPHIQPLDNRLVLSNNLTAILTQDTRLDLLRDTLVTQDPPKVTHKEDILLRKVDTLPTRVDTRKEAIRHKGYIHKYARHKEDTLSILTTLILPVLNLSMLHLPVPLIGAGLKES